MAARNNRRGSSALDSLMAGFAGGATAFIIYAMPQARFDDAVALSGLPRVLSAAQPPLGMTARFAVMAVAGIGIFLLVWLLLRALGRPAPRRKPRPVLEEIEMAPPRLRRADMHPDAPARRPILAGVEFGGSFNDPPALEAPPEETAAADEDPSFPEAEPASQIPAFDEESPDELPAFHQEADEDRQGGSEEPLGAGDFVPEDAVQSEPAALAESASREFGDSIDPIAAAGPQPESDPPTPFARQLPPRPNGDSAIPELMQRLESGLRRRRPARGTSVGEPANGGATAAEPNQLDARLRGAIDELQRLAGRGN